MAGQLELEALLDRQHIPATNAETELKCLIKLWPDPSLRKAEAQPMHNNLCLAFDCSGSMLNRGRLESAINSAKAIVDIVPEGQNLSLVAFQSRIHVLLENVSVANSERDEIKRQIEEIRTLAGGSTNMTDGIKTGAKILERGGKKSKTKGQAKVMIILSDGAADSPDGAERAAAAATEAGVQLFAVGIGADYAADHLLKLVTPSNGTVFGDSEVDRIESTFTALVDRIESFIATNVVLELKLHKEVAGGLSYKTSPEQAFLGNMAPDGKRRVRFNVGNIEKDKAYSFMFLATAPRREGGDLDICEIKLTYDVPSLQRSGLKIETKMVTTYSTDRNLTELINGEVMEVFRRASITQLTERFVEAYKNDDFTQTAKYLKILIKRYDEIGDSALKNHYEGILKDLKGKGTITNSMLNASVVASTVVAGGGELPQVVADDF